jgi:hypothetical protein
VLAISDENLLALCDSVLETLSATAATMATAGQSSDLPPLDMPLIPSFARNRGVGFPRHAPKGSAAVRGSSDTDSDLQLEQEVRGLPGATCPAYFLLCCIVIPRIGQCPPGSLSRLAFSNVGQCTGTEPLRDRILLLKLCSLKY